MSTENQLFSLLQQACRRPELFEKSTVADLWTDPYIAQQMLAYHLDGSTERASRKPEFIDRSVKWIANRFFDKPGISVCDLGCGPGLYAQKLGYHGADVTGIDFSQSSIDYAISSAKKENLNIQYIQNNYLNLSIDKTFDLILMIYCDFCALNPTQRTKLLQVVRNHLKNGGVFLLDVFSHVFFDSCKEKRVFDSSEKNGFWSGDPYYLLSNTFLYDQEKVFLDKHVIVEEKRIWEIYNWLQCYSLETLSSVFEKEGFEVVEYFANVAGDRYTSDSNEIAVVVKKQ